MILQNQVLLDRILAALRGVREADSELMGLLEDLLSDTQNDYNDSDTVYGPDGIQFTYTSESGQGDNLPRGGPRRDDEVRYHRGSASSDERPL